jgi:non-heme Fe2+,alpha-ketoglutarate-dependent halogenase
MARASSILSDYAELGYVEAIPILNEDEVRHYRAACDRTCALLGGNSRLNAPHLFFRWAWDLAIHPRLLDCLEQFLGPAILLKSTRIFYKQARSATFVGWHQDGITEREEGAHVPAIWLGLTEATAENGCLRVVPRSHHLGLVRHEDFPDPDNLTTQGVTAQVEIGAPHDVIMRAGEMSMHHPLVLHASKPNETDEARIGFSATYSNAMLAASRTPVAWVRGSGPTDRFELAVPPPDVPIEHAVDAYRTFIARTSM